MLRSLWWTLVNSPQMHVGKFEWMPLISLPFATWIVNIDQHIVSHYQIALYWKLLNAYFKSFRVSAIWMCSLERLLCTTCRGFSSPNFSGFERTWKWASSTSSFFLSLFLLKCTCYLISSITSFLFIDLQIKIHEAITWAYCHRNNKETLDYPKIWYDPFETHSIRKQAEERKPNSPNYR